MTQQYGGGKDREPATQVSIDEIEHSLSSLIQIVSERALYCAALYDDSIPIDGVKEFMRSLQPHLDHVIEDSPFADNPEVTVLGPGNLYGMRGEHICKLVPFQGDKTVFGTVAGAAAIELPPWHRAVNQNRARFAAALRLRNVHTAELFDDGVHVTHHGAVYESFVHLTPAVRVAIH